MTIVMAVVVVLKLLSDEQLSAQLAALASFVSSDASVPLMKSSLSAITVDELASCRFLSAATDGRFLFIHCSSGLYKVRLCQVAAPRVSFYWCA